MKKYNSLYSKFNFLIVGTIFILGIVLEILFLNENYKTLHNELKNSAYNFARSMENRIIDDILLDNKFDLLEQIYYAKRQNENIRYILVLNDKKDIVATTFEGQIPLKLLEKREDNPHEEFPLLVFDSNESKIDEYMYPLKDGQIGYIRIGMSEKNINDALFKKGVFISIFIFLICLLCSILSNYYAYKILMPITKISKEVSKIGFGKYNQKLNINSKDEVGILARAFDRMIIRLRKKEMENEKLITELKKKKHDNEYLIKELFSARENECKRISKELHDDVSQSIATVMAFLRILKDKLNTEEQITLMNETRNITKTTLDSIRNMAINIHPPLLSDLGLIIAMEKYIETFKTTMPKLNISFSIDGDFSNLNKEISIAIYRVLQGALTNIRKHSKAKNVEINIKEKKDKIHFNIIDDGVGFTQRTQENARLNHHLGIVSMKERVEILGGFFKIYSKIDSGTKIEIILANRKED